MEVSHCECCHADGDPGVLQKGGGGKKERKGSKKEKLEELILIFHVQEVELSECRG